MEQTLTPAALVSTPPAATAPAAARAAAPKLWLTVKDVSKLLSLGVRTLWRMVEAGKLPQPHRFNRKLVRWDRAELVQFVQDLRQAKQAKEGE